MIKYNVRFNVDGGLSHGFGLNEPSNYNEEKEFEMEEKCSPEYIIGKSIILGKKIAMDALSNPNTSLTEVTLLEIYGPNGKISQKEFVSKYSSVGTKSGKSISFEKNNLNQIVLKDYGVEKLLRL